MVGPEIEFTISEEHKLSNGSKVRFTSEEPDRVEPGKTADHEARHIKAAKSGIVSSTIVPGDGYNGLTTLHESDPVAAAAPDAYGCDGTGWDMFVVQALGHNPESMRHEARTRLAGQEDEIYEIASILQERKTITQTDVDEAHRRVVRKRAGIVDVKVVIIDGNGKNVKNEKVQARGGTAMIPGHWVDLPKAA